MNGIDVLGIESYNIVEFSWGLHLVFHDEIVTAVTLDLCFDYNSAIWAK